MRHQLRLPSETTLQQVRTCAQSSQYWYHSFYFEGGGTIRGIYDVGKNVGKYNFPNLSELKVLDVGPGSGWFSAFFAQAGAHVTAVEVPNDSYYDIFGRWEAPLSQGPCLMRPSFDAIMDLLQLNVRRIELDIYSLYNAVSAGEYFDLIFAGSILMHVRDPIGALIALRRVCRGLVVANCYYHPKVDQMVVPVMILAKWSPMTWWIPNKNCLKQWFQGAGFNRVVIRGTVKLTVDNIFEDQVGRKHGKDQSLRLIHASV